MNKFIERIMARRKDAKKRTGERMGEIDRVRIGRSGVNEQFERLFNATRDCSQGLFHRVP